MTSPPPRRLVGLLGVVLAGLSVVSLSAVAASSQVRTAGFSSAVPVSVSALSAKDAWAVGSFYDGSHVRGLVQHWTGSSWRRVALPTPADSVLVGVSAAAPKDVWAVGNVGSESGDTIIAHWDGGAWSVVDHPEPAGGKLLAVSALSPSSAWAVGLQGTIGAFRPLVEHWDGTAWKVVAVPVPPGSTESSFTEISGSGPSDIWAVGSSYDASSTRGLVEHWDGSKWRVVPSPNPKAADQHYLMGVSAIDADDAWAVGESFSPSGDDPRGYTLHWNGRRWQSVSSVIPQPGLYLEGVSATSASDVWAVGTVNTQTYETFIEHWDGTRWSRVPSPSPGEFPGLTGIAASSRRDAWAVGSYVDDGGISGGVYEHWNGSKWTLVGD